MSKRLLEYGIQALRLGFELGIMCVAKKINAIHQRGLALEWKNNWIFGVDFDFAIAYVFLFLFVLVWIIRKLILILKHGSVLRIYVSGWFIATSYFKKKPTIPSPGKSYSNKHPHSIWWYYPYYNCSYRYSVLGKSYNPTGTKVGNGKCASGTVYWRLCSCDDDVRGTVMLSKLRSYYSWKAIVFRNEGCELKVLQQ